MVHDRNRAPVCSVHFYSVSNPLYLFYTFLLTKDCLIITRGVLWKRKSIIPYGRIQNINIKSNPLERILGLATLEIQTAGSSAPNVVEGYLPGISFPEELAEIIMKKVKEYKHSSGIEEELTDEDLRSIIKLLRRRVRT